MVMCYHPCIFASKSKTENDMMKKCFNWMLMAALVCGLSLSFTACSDDDDDNNGAVDEREQSVVNGLVSNDETLLGSLLQAWVPDFTAADIVPGILDKTFVADVGEVDEANATVRTMVMGTQNAADEYAANALGSLGINPQQPVDFSWTNAAIGSVSYQRGSGNELGVINVSVKQLPGLTKIRLVKDPENNAPATPYYSKGDIVKYSGDNKYYICLDDHVVNTDATWISFDCGEEINSLSTGTCGWMGVGTDIVYNKSQAQAQSIVWWLKEFLLSDEGYQSVLDHMATMPKTAINQIVPSTNQLREQLIEKLKRTKDNVVLDVNTTINGEADLRATANYKYVDNQTKTNKVTRTYYPLGMLLADAMRWSMGFTYDYWVPNIVLVSTDDAHDFSGLMNLVPSQSEDESHFKWHSYVGCNYGNGFLFPYITAVHWTHKEFVKDGVTYKNIVEFTQHKRKLENTVVDLNRDADLDWTLRNITSRQLNVKDKGEKYSKFETVYRAKDLAPVIPQDDGKVKPGYLVASNGQFYSKKSAADLAHATPVAMIVYTGKAGDIETGTQYNALAMSLEKYYGYEWSSMSATMDNCTGEAIGIDDLESMSGLLNGMAMTQRLANHECNASHQHPAAEFVAGMDKPVQGENFSKWFIPSAGQYILAMKGQGYKMGENAAFSGGQWLWAAAGYPGLDFGTDWTTTQGEMNDAWFFSITAMSTFSKNIKLSIRPVMALTIPE